MYNFPGAVYGDTRRYASTTVAVLLVAIAFFWVLAFFVHLVDGGRG